MKTIAILGGGVSGLVSAYASLLRGQNVILQEEKDRLGGMIQTIETKYGLVETAANGLLNSHKVEQLIQELDLKVTHHNKASKRRFFWVDGNLRRIPVSFFSLVRGGLGFFFKNAKPFDSETMESWAIRIFGEKFAQRIIEPALGGIYATPLSLMDPRMVFSKFSWKEGDSLFRNFKSGKKNPKPITKGLISFEKGMQELTSALQNRMLDHPNMEVNLNTKSMSLSEFRRNRKLDELKVCMPLSSVYDYLLSDPTSKIFLDQFKISKPKYYSIATITRFSVESIFTKPGFGVLFPRSENVVANGVLSNDSIFPNRIMKQGIHSETWIYSGDWVEGITEEELKARMEEDRTKLLGHKENTPALDTFSKIWKESFPIYNEELYRFNLCLDEIENFHAREEKPVRFLGNYRRGIGLRSLIESAMED